MSGQTQNSQFSQPAVVRDLENRLEAPDKNYAVASSYHTLSRDPAVVLAVRYLALSAIAGKLNLYSDYRATTVLVDEISRQMNSVDANTVLKSIQHLKADYSQIYQLNPVLFDRAVNSAVNCINRSSIHSRSRASVSTSPQPPATDFTTESPFSGFGQSPQFDFVQPPTTINNYSVPSNNNNAIIIGGAMIASAIVFGTFFTLSRNNLQPSLTVSSTPIAIPTPETKAVMPTPSPSLTAEAGIATSMPSPEPTIGSTENPRPTKVVPVPIQSIVPMPSRFEPARSILIEPEPSEQPREVRSSPPSEPSVRIAVNRPSTDEFIGEYYSKLKSDRTESAWNDLSADFQTDRRANPGGYSGDYVKWWGGLGKNTHIGKIETVKANADRAIVRVHCRFNRESYVVRYHLNFDNSSRSWKISKIEKR
jgi:hypothetical protein